MNPKSPPISPSGKPIPPPPAPKSKSGRPIPPPLLAEAEEALPEAPREVDQVCKGEVQAQQGTSRSDGQRIKGYGK